VELIELCPDGGQRRLGGVPPFLDDSRSLPELEYPEGAQIGKARRSGLPLDDRDYQIPFPFTGKINKLTIAVDQPKLTPEDVKKLKEAEARAADAR